MIPESEISLYCQSSTLQRARRIAASGADILTKQCRYNQDETVLSAFVASSVNWTESYRVSVALDESEAIVLDYACTCPAAHASNALCKHCAALILSFNEHPEQFNGYQKQRVPQTSSLLHDIMKRTKTTETPDTAKSLQYGETVDIETVLSYSYQSWSAHFRIVGPRGSYSIKNIEEFVRLMKKGEYHAYGKKLAFAHTPDSLSEHGRNIADFLDQAIEVRNQASPHGARFHGAERNCRSLQLTNHELIELVDLHESRTFTVESNDMRVRSLTTAHVLDEDPYLEATIRKNSEYGYELSLRDSLIAVSQGNRLYVWLDDVFYRCSPGFSACSPVLQAFTDSEDDELFLAMQDVPLFCATALPLIEEPLNIAVPEEIERFKPVDCELEFYFDKLESIITCEAIACYGEYRRNVFSKTPGEEEVAPLIDEQTESIARLIVEQYLSHPESDASRNQETAEKRFGARTTEHGRNAYRSVMKTEEALQRIPEYAAFLTMKDGESIAKLIFEGMNDFQRIGSVFTTPAFDRLTSDKRPRLSMGVSLAGNLIDLDVSADDMDGEELAAVLESYRQRKRYHRLKDGAFLSIENFDLSHLDRMLNDLGLESEDLADGQITIPAFRAFYLSEMLEDGDCDESIRAYIQGFDADSQEATLPAEFESILRPYQKTGYRWLHALCDRGLGGILADEMGLGKSVQLISFLASKQKEAKEFGASLIVCPASLVYNWISEFERFAPNLTVLPIVGSKSERTLTRSNPSCDVFVTSYDLLRIDADDYKNTEFFCHVLDEAQYIKNHTTLTAKNVKKIQAQHRIALTGTPMENRLSELWSIFDFLMPGFFGSYMRFREQFELAVIGGDEDAAERLKALIGPFILRRLKANVLEDLPEKMESIVYAHLGGEQRKLYDANEQHVRNHLNEQRKETQANSRNRYGKTRSINKVEVLAELTKLRQLCCHPGLLYEDYTGESAKLETIMDLIESALSSKEKSLVFSQFTSYLSLIAEKLDERGISYYTITGSTPKKTRMDLVKAFNENDIPVFLVSLKAGGTGLNLVGASVVVHADPWWNAAAQNQATDRAHRIGQKRMVNVYKVIAKDTIEERILNLQGAKQDLADQIISTDSVSLSTLSSDDILELLQP